MRVIESGSKPCKSIDKHTGSKPFGDGSLVDSGSKPCGR